MKRYGDMANPPVAPSSPQVRMMPALEIQKGRFRGRVTQVDQMSSSPQLWEIQQAGQMVAQTLDIRETKIVTLRKDVESGQYSIKAEQVAEKLMQNHLLDLFSY
jgi:flagellar biosynthesis anti-sigma factor FlgM